MRNHHRTTGFLLALFAALAFFVKLGTFDVLNQAMLSFVTAFRADWLTSFFAFWTILFNPLWAAILFAGAIVLLFIFISRHAAAMMAASVVLAALAETVLKALFQVSRPLTPLFPVSGWSFPSGHSAAVAAFCTALYLVLSPYIASRERKFLLATGLSLISLFVGASRIYLAAHWTTDVIEGLLLGLLVSMACYAVSVKFGMLPPRRGPVILDGKKARDAIALRLGGEVSRAAAAGLPVPTLAIIQIGDKPESTAYIRQKKLFGERIGCRVIHERLPESASERDLTSLIAGLNANVSVHGVIVQIPLPAHLSVPEVKDRILAAVAPEKDVDGLGPVSVKALEEGKPNFIPATARGVLGLLDFYKIPLSGQRVVVVGRSALVGKPTALALMNRGATVMVCHSKTPVLSQETRRAVIVVVAVGKPGLIGAAEVAPGQVIVDVGINAVSMPVMQSGGAFRPPAHGAAGSETLLAKLQEEVPKRKLVGDVDFVAVSPVVRAISPVPGGVGPMTVACLFENVLEAWKRQVAGKH